MWVSSALLTDAKSLSDSESPGNRILAIRSIIAKHGSKKPSSFKAAASEEAGSDMAPEDGARVCKRHQGQPERKLLKKSSLVNLSPRSQDHHHKVMQIYTNTQKHQKTT
jgi:hypothetical protein